MENTTEYGELFIEIDDRWHRLRRDISDDTFNVKVCQILIRKSQKIKKELYGYEYNDIYIVKNVISSSPREEINYTKLCLKVTQRGIYMYNMLIPYAYALVNSYPNISDYLVYNHLLTNRYLFYQEEHKIIKKIKPDFVLEDHDAILADFQQKLKYIHINQDTFKINILYEELLRDIVGFSSLTSRMIASFLD